jgi:signal transduction histidine kinase
VASEPRPQGSGRLRVVEGAPSLEDEVRTLRKALREATDRQHRLVARLVSAQEEERRSLSENLHDDTIQVISAIGFRLEALRYRLHDPQALADLDRLQTVVRNAVSRLRHLVFELRPPELDSAGLIHALRMYVSQNTDPDGPRHSLVDRIEREPPIPVRLKLYRMAQEALTNVRKHARAANATVEVASTEDGYLLRVVDDGVGCSPEDALRPRPGHLGLAAMRERAELAGGRLTFESVAGKGTAVEIRLPSR